MFHALLQKSKGGRVDYFKALYDKTILVTGGAGFIGSHLCERLLEYGANVTCVDNFLTGDRGFVRKLQKEKAKFKLVEADVNDHSAISKVFHNRHVDYIFHYASLVGVKRTMEEPMAVFRDMRGTEYIANLAREANVKKIIYASSSEVYGNTAQVPYQEEKSPQDTRTPYSVVKNLNEIYLLNLAPISKIPVTILRFFNVYGPRQIFSDYGFVVGKFITQALSKKPLTIYNDGSQTRDFTYIDDNIEAALRALLSEGADNQIINVGTGNEISIWNLASQVGTLCGLGHSCEKVMKPGLHDTRRRVADVTKMEKLLGFLASTSLSVGLQKTIAWYKESTSY